MVYTDWLTAMVTYLNIADTAGITAFTALAPRFIEYAELRMQRDPDLDFLATRVVDLSQMTTGGMRSVAIPANFVVHEGANRIIPAGSRPYAGGAMRIPLQRTSRQFCDFIWPNETSVLTPDSLTSWYYALFSQQEPAPAPAEADELVSLPSSIIIAPTPDNEYVVEQTGTQRIPPLSATNTSNFMTLWLPDMYIAASMVAASGYQRDFGAQTSDPNMAVSWERIYQDLKNGAAVESLRQKARVDGFSPFPPQPMAPSIPGPSSGAQTG